ncbi:hypothetical protein [Siphonobacter sp. SORGH_AS_0500]|uniref:hypothetical protein n=1 Tax=Siphonobacter sp. SORGH_AS_0500 TaxID=1864824 RepID=UPI0028560881|nr:hypothetical protein [Siphonobacter sp. SORGH_AS_0500]MDR6197704.1 hypothetical protein [Siphonobacter sp. SORGH_AS_0500]
MRHPLRNVWTHGQKMTVFLLLLGIRLMAQNIGVEGIISTSDRSSLLPVINILIKGTTQEMVSDVKGTTYSQGTGMYVQQLANPSGYQLLKLRFDLV